MAYRETTRETKGDGALERVLLHITNELGKGWVLVQITNRKDSATFRWEQRIPSSDGPENPAVTILDKVGGVGPSSPPETNIRRPVSEN